MIKTLAVLVALSLFGCTSNENTFYIKTDHARGLKKSSEIYCQGIEIGKITDISLNGDSVLITMAMDKDFEFSRKAEILLYNSDLYTKALEIKSAGPRKDICHSGDTIRVVLGYGAIEIDSL